MQFSGTFGIPLPITVIQANLSEGVVFTTRVDVLPLSNQERYDLSWGRCPDSVRPIVEFAALNFAHTAPWSRA